MLIGSGDGKVSDEGWLCVILYYNYFNGCKECMLWVCYGCVYVVVNFFSVDCVEDYGYFFGVGMYF